MQRRAVCFRLTAVCFTYLVKRGRFIANGATFTRISKNRHYSHINIGDLDTIANGQIKTFNVDLEVSLPHAFSIHGKGFQVLSPDVFRFTWLSVARTK